MSKFYLTVFALVALIAIVNGQCTGETTTTDCTQDKIYTGCFCFFEWNDDNRVGNWSFNDYWLQLEEPAEVGFVSIAGDNTITVKEDKLVNEVYVGPNRWDTTRLVLEADLTITYDDVPVIMGVHGYRMVTGETRLSIQGKGFGFESSAIQVTATEIWDDDDQLIAESDTMVLFPEDVVPITYDCEHVTLGYRDAKIECNISPIHLLPHTLRVAVTANGYTTDSILITDYIQ